MNGIRTFTTHIELDGETTPVGTVEAEDRRGRTVRVEFSYDRDYLARRARPVLDPSVPLTSGRQVSATLPRGMADAGPDGWGRRLLVRAHRGADVSDVDFLLGVSDGARIGALRFSTPDSGPGFVAASHDIPRLVALDDLAESARAVEQDADDLAAVRRLLDAGSANLGGVRPKASIRSGRHLAIAKFPSTTDETDAMAWEKLCLDIAASAGIAVPVNRLVEIGRGRALLLERFDRTADDHRIPYLSAFTLSDAPNPASGDYLDLADSLREVDVADYAGTLRELWRRVALSIALHNTDDHLKNHGVLWSPEGWTLSPAFDITPDPIDGAQRVTTLDGEQLPAREARALLHLAEMYGIAAATQRRILDDVLTAADGWQSRAEQLGIAEGEITRQARSISPALSRLREAAESIG